MRCFVKNCTHYDSNLPHHQNSNMATLLSTIANSVRSGPNEMRPGLEWSKYVHYAQSDGKKRTERAGGQRCSMHWQQQRSRRLTHELSSRRSPNAQTNAPSNENSCRHCARSRTATKRSASLTATLPGVENSPGSVPMPPLNAANTPRWRWLAGGAT
jgi:hypothetical protein